MLIKLFWKEILVAISIAICAYLVYDKIYENGFEEANKKHKEYLASYEKKLDTRILELKDLSISLKEDQKVYQEKLEEDMRKILSNSKKSPLIVYKEGKCTLSPNFLDSYNAVINRANQK